MNSLLLFFHPWNFLYLFANLADMQCSIVYEIQEWTNNWLSWCCAMWIPWTIRKAGQHVWSFSSSEVILIFLLSSPRPVHHRPSYQWVNHIKTCHPYPERMYNFNLQEVVVEFYPLFSRLKFRHSSSFADSCACTDALFGREVIPFSLVCLMNKLSSLSDRILWMWNRQIRRMI